MRKREGRSAKRGVRRANGELRRVVPVLVLLLSGCSDRSAPQLRRESRLLMDTYVSVSVFAPPGRADKALAATFNVLGRIDHVFNHLDTTSPVYAFNTRNEPLTDSGLVSLVRSAEAVSEATAGAFDITVEPLVRLWGFYGENPGVPQEQAIDSCLRLVGFRNLVVEAGRVTKRYPWVRIDVGGIAKGYALAEAGRVLRASGVDSALIDLGGDVYALGRKGREGWRIGIRDPRGEGVIGIAAVSGLAVVTSGDYERFFFGPDSVRYCHIFDPRTGWPAQGITSATVFTPDPVAAQGWSKALFILGADALPLLESLPGTEALAVTSEGEILGTSGAHELVETVRPIRTIGGYTPAKAP